MFSWKKRSSHLRWILWRIISNPCWVVLPVPSDVQYIMYPSPHLPHIGTNKKKGEGGPPEILWQNNRVEICGDISFANISTLLQGHNYGMPEPHHQFNRPWEHHQLTLSVSAKFKAKLYPLSDDPGLQPMSWLTHHYHQQVSMDPRKIAKPLYRVSHEGCPPILDVLGGVWCAQSGQY